jgi:hypothetical protein
MVGKSSVRLPTLVRRLDGLYLLNTLYNSHIKINRDFQTVLGSNPEIPVVLAEIFCGFRQSLNRRSSLKWSRILICIQELSGSNPGRDTEYS